MTAPDKIYIRESIDGLSEMWYQEKRLRPSIFATHEYISKEALLGWLDGKVYEHNEDRFDDGFNAALGQVIDKLNSM